MPERQRPPTLLLVRILEQRRLLPVVSESAAGRVETPLEPAERFGLVLGVTCHAVYHAGQIQLLKRWSAE
jgi:hypothetical protein